MGLLEGLGRVTRAVAMSENGDTVVTGGDDRMVRFFNLGRECGDVDEEGLNSDRAWLGWGVKSVCKKKYTVLNSHMLTWTRLLDPRERGTPYEARWLHTLTEL